MNASIRGLHIAPLTLIAGVVLGGCSLSEELTEQTSHADAIADRAREMVTEQRIETKTPGYGGYGGYGGYDNVGAYDNPYVDNQYVDNPYVDDPYIVDTPGEVVGGPGPGGYGLGGQTYVERGPGYVTYVSCDEFGTCVRRTESFAGYGTGYGYGYGCGY